ncbi:MAG: GNAT family N-acetyltransferase [Proteobacteria bacterium]|nr:GNAT family N-acetyltransferase [Pseudomonadota bacterium]
MSNALGLEPVDGRTVDVATALLSQFFEEEGFATPRAKIAANLRTMLNDAACWCALAIAGGQARGIVTVTTMRYVEQGLLGEIGDLYVLPEHRGQGIARFLVGEAKRWCRGRGCAGVYVTITKEGEARHALSQFYARFDFCATGRSIWSLRLG